MQENNLIVNSSPSKTFFIDMITKDVSVESAILDRKRQILRLPLNLTPLL